VYSKGGFPVTDSIEEKTEFSLRRVCQDQKESFVDLRVRRWSSDEGSIIAWTTIVLVEGGRWNAERVRWTDKPYRGEDLEEVILWLRSKSRSQFREQFLELLLKEV
jgi:hypothetical protein